MQVTQHTRGKARAWLLPLIVAPFLLSACTDYSRLQYRQDERLTFTSPTEREEVVAPVRITWNMRDFTVAKPGSDSLGEDGGYFAVFVDRAPIKPGHTLEDIASKDDVCREDPTCPDRQYLADHGVYVTTRTTLVLENVQPLANAEQTQLHEVTVVLMDTSGHRIGESAWVLHFKMKKVTVG